MKQLGELKVRDYMSPQVVVIREDEPLSEAIRLMEADRLSVLPVVNQQENLIGILASSDLIELTREIQADLSALHLVTQPTQEYLINILIDQGETTLVNKVMAASVVSIDGDVDMVIAAKLMIDNDYHHLPVVDQAGKTIGVISTSDFVRAFAETGAAMVG